MKKLFCILYFLLLIGSAYSDGTSQRYNNNYPNAPETKLYANSTLTVNSFGICKILQNTSSRTYFIPTGLSQDWSSFLSHIPNGILATGCSVDCVGAWGACVAGVKTFNWTTSPQNSGAACSYANGATTTSGCLGPVDGICGSTTNLCLSGNLSSTSESSTQYLWQCLGVDGGLTVSCNTAKSCPARTMTTIEIFSLWNHPFGVAICSPGFCRMTIPGDASSGIICSAAPLGSTDTGCALTQDIFGPTYDSLWFTCTGTGWKGSAAGGPGL